MESLIIVAHGSKLKSSNDEIIRIVENIKLIKKDSLVYYAFLELAEPLLGDILETACKNSNSIKIFPYFLAGGKHVISDIPNEIKIFQKKYPNIKFEILPHIGKCAGIENLIISNS